MMSVSRRTLALSLVVSLLALAFAVYGAAVSPAAAPPARPAPPALAASRFFVLMPDGRVEMTDAWSRRTFRWDGHRWVELPALALPRPESR
jgi:hypothetical protein